MADANGDDGDGTLVPPEVGVATIPTETEQFTTLSDDRLRESLSRLDLLGESAS